MVLLNVEELDGKRARDPRNLVGGEDDRVQADCSPGRAHRGGKRRERGPGGVAEHEDDVYITAPGEVPPARETAVKDHGHEVAAGRLRKVAAQAAKCDPNLVGGSERV